MKKSITLLLVLVVLSGVFSGCILFPPSDTTTTTTTTPPDPVIYTVELSETELTMDVFDTAVLTATVKDPEGNVYRDQEIVWSSDHPEIVSVEGGKLDAVSKGTAVITASTGEFSASCTVSVDALVRPQILVPQAEMDLAKNQQRVIIPSVKFKTVTLDNTVYSITYSFESKDESIATIDENGNISAVGVGETEIVVTANIPRATEAGIDGNLSVTVKLRVLANFSMNIGIADGEGSVIYLQGAGEYKDSSKLTVLDAIYEGNDISGEISFVSSDEEILLVSADGVVTLAPTAQVGDKATVWCQYISATEGAVKSNAVEFTVDKAMVEKPTEGEYIIDASAEDAGADIADLFGADFEIIGVYDIDDIAKTNLWNAESGKLDASKITAFGNRTLVVEGARISYKVNVLLVSKVITTIKEFTDIFYSSSKINEIKATGYYILGNNIDAGDAAYVGRGWYSGDACGLVGTFDGRGYTIDGFNISAGGGIFGVISSTATLKNTAFTNIKVNVPTGHAEVLGYAVLGTVENCYFGINELSTGYTSGTIGLFAQANDKNIFKNIVVVANCNIEIPEGFGADKWGMLEAAANKGAWENTFVISSDRLFGGANAGDNGNQYSKSVQRFDSMSDLLASDYYAEKKVAFPESIWNLATMTFKSSEEIFTAELNGLQDAYELSMGEAAALLNNYNAYVITANTNKISVAGGKITAEQLITAADGAKVTFKWGDLTKEASISTKNETTLGATVYLNDANGEGIVINGVPTSLTALKAYALGIDGNEVELAATAESGVVTISKEALASVTASIATGANELRLVLEGDANYYVKDVTFVWVINNATELLKMREHLTANGSIYDGMLALGADIDLDGVTIKNHGWTNSLTFAGEFDGRGHTLSNVAANTGNIGLFSNVSGTIKNLKVNGTVSSNTALVVGATLTGTVENVYVSGAMTADGMSASSNLANFGAGLLAGRIGAGSKINNAIVEITSMTEGLRLGTAFGKLHGTNDVNIFKNCYSIGESGSAYMPYNQGWTKADFAANSTNASFDSMWTLWTTNESAKALAVSFGIAEPREPHDCQNVCPECGLCLNGDCAEPECADKCQGHAKEEITITVSDLVYYANEKNGADLVISDERLTGTIETITVGGLSVSGASVANGALTIPAAALKADNMPTGVLAIELETDAKIYHIEGTKFVWVMNTASDILKMRNHLTTTDNINYAGALALGADIDLNGVTVKNHGWTAAMTFTGEFDGRNYTLSNIAANTGNIGLFTNVSGTIKNLKVTGTVSSNTALIVGGGLTGTVENVYVSGAMTADGMSASSNLKNFGAGLLAGRIQSGAKISNTIVEVTSMTEGLRLGTAFGKLHGTNNTSIFNNCYAVNAVGATYMPYDQGWTKADFAADTANATFDTMYALWSTNETAKALAVSFGIEEPKAPHACTNACEECGKCLNSDCAEPECAEKCAGHVKGEITITVSDMLYYANETNGADLVITDAQLTGTASSATVAGLSVNGASVANGALTIPAASMKLDTMPTGAIVIVVETSTNIYTINGVKVVWVINNASDLLKMKNHLTVATDGKTYNGMLALGADINLSGVTVKNNGMTGTVFAGEFDGRNHTLSNHAAATGNIGLFADVSGTVKNLKMTGTVSANTALVVGGALTGTIENVYVSGAMTKDGMSATSNLANFGAGLLAGRIQSTAKINNTIVEITSIADGLRLGTAFGKLHGTNNTSIFTNCYAVNAAGATYMPYNQGWTKADFPTGATNANFATMADLWADEKASALAAQLGLTQ